MTYPKEYMNRKVIQISSAEDGVLVALCDDGTIWAKLIEGWFILPPIPQDEIPTTE